MPKKKRTCTAENISSGIGDWPGDGGFPQLVPQKTNSYLTLRLSTTEKKVLKVELDALQAAVQTTAEDGQVPVSPVGVVVALLFDAGDVPSMAACFQPLGKHRDGTSIYDTLLVGLKILLAEVESEGEGVSDMAEAFGVESA